jgi:hypothetical protein
LIVCTTRAFARASQPVNWVLKSAGEANARPGMNEVSNQPLRRSTRPFAFMTQRVADGLGGSASAPSSA